MSDQSRRAFLAGSVAAAGGVLLGGPEALARGFRAARPAVPAARAGGFSLGVMSGFPSTTGAVLWTRVDDLPRTSTITLEVATDRGFRRVVQRRRVRASAVRDYTARSQVTGLRPGEEYFYRFHTRTTDSPVGRLRTLRPADSAEPVRIGVLSCQSYEAGYYTAIAGLAAEPDLDLVLHLGDYIYEHHYYDGPAARRDTTGPGRDGDVQTLDEFRAKYRLYKRDPNLQAMHAAHPFVPIWDDHEVEDNYAGTGPDSISRSPAKTENDNAYPRRVSFAERRRAGYLSYFEYQPRVRPAGDTRIYGTVPLGAGATVFLTDQRQYRTPQPCHDAIVQPCADDHAPGATMLGATQKAWFKDALARDTATWKLWASEVMLMGWDSAPGVPLNQDGWDGYGAEREEILTHVRDRGIRNLAVLTGDIHTYVAGTLTTTGRVGGTPVATEFVGGSVTSLGLESTAAAPLTPFSQALLATNPHISYLDTRRRGYMVVEATKAQLSVRFRSPASILVPESPVSTSAAFTVEAGSTAVHRA
ncbi:alkaline phosphatase D family protein [Paraconexibacter antarcticus]|uniref:Alkaline phosphatase D family protein n=1 Tax=Paraconexibacter antarcticus TaxID=2949664 RepID=A0ABY5DYC6_9ACTN|nr:alkaline phosphatase D family protein [Paraconexibacter antarcticus]UTI65867.1 alkaline phosphatase D family protein [Paraconexibacter antarcticus]